MKRFLFRNGLTLLGVGWLLIVAVLALNYAPNRTVEAQSTGSVDAYGYESITVATTAIGFTPALVSPPKQPSAKLAILTVETGAVRYRYDGTDPTAVEGHAAAVDATLTVYGINNINRMRLIRSGATSATVKVTFLR